MTRLTTSADGGLSVLGQEQPGERAAARDQAGQPPDGSPERRGLAFKLAIGAAIVAALAILAGTAGLAVTAGSGQKKPATGAARQVSARRGNGPARPLRVLSISPAPGATRLSGTTSVEVTFSARVDGGSAHPRLSPGVPGTWQATGGVLTFTPASPLPPSTRFTLRIPAGQAGVRSAAGGTVARPVRSRFSTAAYSHRRLAELLSSLGYLPLSWSPRAGGRLSGDPENSRAVSQQDMAYSPPAGTFAWQRGYPAALHSQWRANAPNPLVRGAVMAFKAQHHMAISAATGAKFWRRLLAAAEQGQRNRPGYTYAIARKSSPETLTIWHDGRVVLRSLANTGIPIRPTSDGSFPVYLRYQYQVMRGINPDGSHYADPVSFVAYFNGGDAVHYFPRGSYGFEQSLGCVELPYTEAERAWPYLTYGSLVTVTG
jgi:hypothetical protein